MPAQYDRLFGFALREAVTNVLRHSGATSCCVRLTPSSVEIRDDGRGAPVGDAEASPGTGCTGSAPGWPTRVAGSLTDSPAGGGFRLLVDMAKADDAALAGLA